MNLKQISDAVKTNKASKVMTALKKAIDKTPLRPEDWEASVEQVQEEAGDLSGGDFAEFFNEFSVGFYYDYEPDETPDPWDDVLEEDWYKKFPKKVGGVGVSLDPEEDFGDSIYFRVRFDAGQEQSTSQTKESPSDVAYGIIFKFAIDSTREKVEANPRKGIYKTFERRKKDGTHKSDYFLCSDGAEYELPSGRYSMYDYLHEGSVLLQWVIDHNVK